MYLFFMTMCVVIGHVIVTKFTTTKNPKKKIRNKKNWKKKVIRQYHFSFKNNNYVFFVVQRGYITDPRGIWDMWHSASPRATYPIYHSGRWYNPILYGFK